MKISIIVPVYNEEKFVKQSLTNLVGVDFLHDTEYIIVDDASTDKSVRIIESFKNNSNKNIIILKKEKNQGKGSALRTGFEKSSGDIIMIHDADLEYNPNNLKALFDELLKLGDLYFVYGSRFLKKETNWVIPSHYIGNKFLSYIVSLACKQMVGDMETCYKIFFSKALKNITLKSNDFRIEPEITIKLLKTGLKIKELPIDYYPRTFKEGKKINYKDGIKALVAIIKFTFSKKND